MDIRQLLKVLAGYLVTMSIATTLIYAATITVAAIVSLFGMVVPKSALYTWGPSYSIGYALMRMIALILIAVLLYFIIKLAPNIVPTLFSKLAASPLKSAGVQRFGGKPLSSPFSTKFWGLDGKKLGSKARDLALRSSRRKKLTDAQELRGMLGKDKDKKNTGKKSTATKDEHKKTVDARDLKKKRDMAALQNKGRSEDNARSKRQEESESKESQFFKIAALTAFSRLAPKTANAYRNALGMKEMMDRNSNMGRDRNFFDAQYDDSMRDSNDMQQRMFRGREGELASLHANTDEEKAEAWNGMLNENNREFVGEIDDQLLNSEAQKTADHNNKLAHSVPGLKSEEKEGSKEAAAMYGMSTVSVDDNGFPAEYDSSSEANIATNALSNGYGSAFLDKNVTDNLSGDNMEVSETDLNNLEGSLRDENINVGTKGVSITGDRELQDRRGLISSLENNLGNARTGTLFDNLQRSTEMGQEMAAAQAAPTAEQSMMATPASLLDDTARTITSGTNQEATTVHDLVQSIATTSPKNIIQSLEKEVSGGNEVARSALDAINVTAQPASFSVEDIKGALGTMQLNDTSALSQALDDYRHSNSNLTAQALAAQLNNIDASDRNAVLQHFNAGGGAAMQNQFDQTMTEHKVTDAERQFVNRVISSHITDEGVVNTASLQRQMSDMAGDAQRVKEDRVYDLMNSLSAIAQQHRVESFVPASQSATFNNDALVTAVKEALSQSAGGRDFDTTTLSSQMARKGITVEKEEIKQAIMTGEGDVARALRQAIGSIALADAVKHPRGDSLTQGVASTMPAGTVVHNHNYDYSDRSTHTHQVSPTIDVAPLTNALSSFLSSSVIGRMNADSPANTAHLSAESLQAMSQLNNTIVSEARINPDFDTHSIESMPADIRRMFNDTMRSISNDFKITASTLQAGGRSRSSGDSTDARTEQIETAMRLAISKVADRARKS